MKVSTLHWHIEVSSVCTLKCPRCPRMEVPETLLNRQLDLAFFKERFGEENIKAAQKISFCGNDGDPIYAKEFLEICEWIKFINPEISLLIVTNGSYKQTNWWYKLSQILDERDEIHWSVDGWDQQSNERYRVNSNWKSITNGMAMFKEYNHTTYTVLATIAFRFNENDLDKIKQIAETYDMDAWQLTKSTKWTGPDDLLQPTKSDMVSSVGRFEREVTRMSNKPRPDEKLRALFLDKASKVLNSSEYPALCYVGTKGLFLRANGEMYPCCWTATRYEHNKNIIAQAESNFNLFNRTLTEILNDDWWNGDFKKFDNLDCRSKCTRAMLSDENQVTEW